MPFNNFGAAWHELRVVNDLRDRKNDRVNIVRPMERRMGTVNDSRRFIVSKQ